MRKAVFFDLYETLITEWDGEKKKALISLDRLGIERNIYKREWALRWERRMNGEFPDFITVLHDIYQSLGLTPDEQVIRDVNEERHHAKAVPFYDIDSRVIEMLDGIKARGLKMGLISNCAVEEVAEWTRCDLVPYFDDIIFSYEVRLAKPDPRIYHLGCERLDVTPDEAIFVGDGGSNEWEGAKRAGLSPFHAAWFQPEWLNKGKPGVPRCDQPRDLLRYIDQF